MKALLVSPTSVPGGAERVLTALGPPPSSPRRRGKTVTLRHGPREQWLTLGPLLARNSLPVEDSHVLVTARRGG